MKKSIAVGMVLLATVVFSGCSTQKEDNSAKSNNSKTEQTTKKKTKNKFEKTNQKMIDAQKMPISLDKYFSYSGYDIKSGLDEEYKIAKSTKELMGNYSFKDDNKTSLLTINKNGTYTIFSSFPDVDLESNDVVTYGHYYFDKNGEVHQKSQLVNTSVESGVLFQKYGKTYMYPIDLVNNPQSVDENGQLVVIARQNLLETKDDFKQRKIDNVDLIDVSRTNGCDVIKKNNDGISLQVLQKDAESDDGFVNKYGDVDEIKKGSYTDSKIVTLNFNKLNKMPKETNKSAKQFVYGLKNKSFSSLNEFYQSVEFDNYSSDDKVMKADLDNLQDGYTSDNENPKIKYAFIIDEKSDAGDSYYVFATDGKKVYYSDKLDDSNSKVEEWQDRSPLNN